MRYHWFSVLSIIIVLSPAGHMTPLSPWDDMHTKHSWNAVPSEWKSLGGPPAGTAIDLHVALKPHRENALIEMLRKVSDPMHPKYGAHLSKEQVAELVAPHPDTLELVHSWFRHHSVPSSSVSVTHGGGTLTFTDVPLSRANDLLGASYQLYRHVETNETILRTVSYSLPTALHAHVQTVAPTTCFASPGTQLHAARKQSSNVTARPEKVVSGKPVMMPSNRDENDYATPSFLRWLYNTWGYTPGVRGWSVLGVVGFIGHYPSPTDLKAFMGKYSYGDNGAYFTVVQINGGGYDPSKPNSESNLDIQYAEAMAFPSPHIFYSTGLGQSGAGDWYLSWLRYIIDEPIIPQTISISYGTHEKDYPEDNAIQLCLLFAQLGLRGVSVLVSSGDYGVGPGDCKAKDGYARFVPRFPSSCPWVTSVGGTWGCYPEVAASFSGGGFSNLFGRPDYQQQAVSTYLSYGGNQYQGLYNPFGRGIPDISAQALKFPIFLNGREILVSGTSASTPVVAGIISLLNDYLHSEGRPPLGFLNYWLYGRAITGLNDIVSGSNPGCNTDGFPAILGWDPVTGLGTPDFERLQRALTPNPKG